MARPFELKTSRSELENVICMTPYYCYNRAIATAIASASAHICPHYGIYVSCFNTAGSFSTLRLLSL